MRHACWFLIPDSWFLTITGVHALIYTDEAEKLRAFFRDVLEAPCVDTGQGWLIFALPPAERGIYPKNPNDSRKVTHESYLMCDDTRPSRSCRRGASSSRGRSQIRGLG